MSKQPYIPDPETSKRLLANLRKTRLQMREFNLELDEILARLEQESRERQLERVRRSLANLESSN
jgi:hypothetical protein